MIPTYHCAGFLGATLQSVLAQDPGADVMQITVVDDGSTRDDPQAVVETMGRGRVEFHRQPENVGHVRNFNTCLQLARGQLVHLLHGDDLVRETFYRTMLGVFERNPEIGAAFCRYIAIDEEGIWLTLGEPVQRQAGVIPNWLEQIASGQRLQAPSIVVRRGVYEDLGGFDERIRSYGEDWEMWVRIAAHYPVAYEPEPLAMYRVHTASLTGRASRDGQGRRDMLAVLELNRAHLPPDRADELSWRARRAWATALFRRARRHLAQGDRTFPGPAIRDAWAFERSSLIALHTAWLGALWGVRGLVGLARGGRMRARSQHPTRADRSRSRSA